MRSWLPSAKLDDQSEVRLHARGTLSDLGLELRLRSLAGSVAARGRIELGEIKSYSAEVEAKDVDLGALLEGPSTKLVAHARMKLVQHTGTVLEGDYSAELDPGTLGAYGTPAARLTGTLRKDPDGDTFVSGALHVAESGAPIDASYHLRRNSTGGGVVGFEVRTVVANPTRAKLLLGAEGVGQIIGSGEIDLHDSEVRANVNGALQRIGTSSVRAESIRFEGRVMGPLAEPQLRFDANGRDVATRMGRLAGVQVRINGRTDRLEVAAAAQRDASRAGQLRATVAFDRGIRISDVYGKLTSSRGPVELRAGAVSIAGERVEVERVRLDGMGELDVSGHYSPQRFAARVAARKLDLGRVAEWIGEANHPKGLLDIEGDVRGTLANPEGVFEGRLLRAGFGDVRDFESEFSVALKHGKMDGALGLTLNASRIKVAFVDVDWPGGNLRRARLGSLHGELSAKGQLELDALRSPLAALGLPIERASGTVELDIQVRNHRDHGTAPTASVFVRTKGLRLIEQRSASADVDSPATAARVQPRVLEGVDVELRADVDGKTERAMVHSVLSDPVGELIRIDGELPVPALDAADPLRALMDAPLNVRVHVPERQLETLPRIVRPNVLRGSIFFDALADGSLRSPRMLAQLSATRISGGEGRNYIDGAVVAEITLAAKARWRLPRDPDAAAWRR
ncbi:MAG: hypothetical protein QM784_08340 [Polyangiaceae bacterium]